MDEWGTQIEAQYSNQIRRRKGGSWKPALSSWPLRFCVGTEAPLEQREPDLNSLGQNMASREGYGTRAGPGAEPFRHKRMTVSLRRASGRMRSLTSHTSVFPMHPGTIQRAGKLRRRRPGRKQSPTATASRERLTRGAGNTASYQVLQGPHEGSAEAALVQLLGISQVNNFVY